jgi:hypothetical protein
MTSYLILTVYEPDSEMNQSDQITVPADLWTTLDRDHELKEQPMFVSLGEGCVGRLRPAVPSEGLANDSCRVPAWMWMQMGCPNGSDDECWTALTKCELPVAGTLVLRARREADLTGSADPVAMLTDALSGSAGMSWACLCTGAELPLPCGVFDVMEIRSLEDFPVPAACILNCDVNLEIVPALDAAPPTPEPAVTPVQPVAAVPSKNGFIPFSGVGRRLCD